MRMNIRPVAALLLAILLPARPGSAGLGGMTDGDRQRLLAHLEMTESWLATEVAGLSDAQRTFRPSPDAWTITDVVEHLAVAEGQYWTSVQESMQRPVSKVKPEATDASILWYGIDRTERQKTGAARVPTGRWPTLEGPLGQFRQRRAEMRAYATSTQDDLRGHALIDGNMDVYQWFLMISTHAQRHVLQIREIKANASYPPH